MSKAGQKIIDALDEAIAFVKGEANGSRLSRLIDGCLVTAPSDLPMREQEAWLRGYQAAIAGLKKEAGK